MAPKNPREDLAELDREISHVRELLEHDAGRRLTDRELEALANGEPPPGSPLEDEDLEDLDSDELEDDDEDGLEEDEDDEDELEDLDGYDELEDTCPRSSSA